MAFDDGATPFPATFDPVAFFGGRTTGYGVVRSVAGRIVRRCRIETSPALTLHRSGDGARNEHPFAD